LAAVFALRTEAAYRAAATYLPSQAQRKVSKRHPTTWVPLGWEHPAQAGNLWCLSAGCTEELSAQFGCFVVAD